jgi:hypothetical protein
MTNIRFNLSPNHANNNNSNSSNTRNMKMNMNSTINTNHNHNHNKTTTTTTTTIRSRRFIALATTATILGIAMIIQLTLLTLVTKGSFLTAEELQLQLDLDQPTKLLRLLDERVDRHPKPEREPLELPSQQLPLLQVLLSQTKTETETETETASSSSSSSSPSYLEKDKDCPFRDSPVYRSIYVYPNPDDEERWKGDILSGAYTNLTWPWLAIQRKTKSQAIVHYNPKRPTIQYNSELLVELLLKHPDSCLRTDDPDQAKLFYVPYMPSLEYHNGTNGLGDYKTSPFGKALIEAIDHQDYTLWERTFGLTSNYWKRRDGADHILVMSEPLHGLYHPKSRRGNYHYVNTQKQLAAPIIMSVEVSTTFVRQYPHCARKNILLPYPNTDGEWFNSLLDDEYGNYTSVHQKTRSATLPQERQLPESTVAALRPRPYAQFYSAGNHGSCQKLRKVLNADYKCSASHKALQRNTKYDRGYRQATFCPCPGGDSPSAKRMFDALHAGCIPLILSKDFVWPFSNELLLFDNTNNNSSLVSTTLDPSLFSIRLDAKEFNHPKRNETTCQLHNASQRDLQGFLEDGLKAQQIHDLRRNARSASDAYSWYEKGRGLPKNPLIHDVLPTGGTAHRVVRAWAERADGVLWPACRNELEELRRVNSNNDGKLREDVRSFEC